MTRKRRLSLTLWESILFERAGFQEGRDYGCKRG